MLPDDEQAEMIDAINAFNTAIDLKPWQKGPLNPKDETGLREQLLAEIDPHHKPVAFSKH